MSEQDAERTELQQAIDKAGLPVVVLAHRAGVSPVTLHYWRKYGIPPKSRTRQQRIADALGVDLAKILPQDGAHGGGL